jgi:type VI secretion system secreted protein VgrG
LASSGKFTQENRFISLNTPLGEDVLLLASFTGHEGISRLFQFNLDLLSEKKDIAFKDIVGQKVTIKMETTDGSSFRYWNGYVSRFAQSGSDARFARYQMEVVPWLWFLTRSADCKIFQKESILDIFDDVISDSSFSSSDYKKSLTGTYKPLEYCVQYRETDFNFISRLLEHAGIYYYFEHAEDKHTLVLADAPSAHTDCPGESSVRYSPNSASQIDDVITSFQLEQELRTGNYTLRDYNFETPAANMEATDPTFYPVAKNTDYEIYDYPGIYGVGADGKALAKIRMQEEEVSHLVAGGSSTCRTLAAGYNFDLEDFDRDDMNKSYLLTDIQHVASNAGTYYSGAGSSSSYSNRFSCIDASFQYRAPRLTPKPFIQGLQTAVVTGPGGEEIYTDKYGRVKVQFFWDRLGQKNEDSSCWVRVSHVWAGKGWGGMFIPRVGQEVIVSFLEGDPDRPIITGRVYNADQNVPYLLPDHGTVSALRSRSSKGGAAANANEIRFEDKKGSEQFFINAEKDMDVFVENDSRENVGNNHSLTIKKDHMEDIGGDAHLNVTGNINQKAGQNVSLDIGQNLYEKSGMNYAHEAGTEIHLKAGMNVVIESGMELTIKAGGNFVNIGPAGVAISGTLVLINSGGAAGSGGAASTTSPTKPDAADDANTSSGGKFGIKLA